MDADFTELTQKVEGMIVRQEQMIADIITAGGDPHEAIHLLQQMEALARAIQESFALFKAGPWH